MRKYFCIVQLKLAGWGGGGVAGVSTALLQPAKHRHIETTIIVEIPG
jgi:hypothetical protein